MSGDFTPEQKRYLEGFVSGVQARGGNGFLGSGNPPPAVPEPTPMGPDAPHLLAQDEAIKAGKKLVDREKWKREEHPFDAYHKLRGQAGRDEYPKAADNFRWRFFGLFYVAPAQLVVPMEYTGGTAMTVKTATRAGRATNGVAKMGSAMGMIDTERDRRQATLLLASALSTKRWPSVNATLRKPAVSFCSRCEALAARKRRTARSARRSSPVGAFVPRQWQ